jgi:hypothetical protein
MKLSKRRQELVYRAIHEQIVDVRLAVIRTCGRGPHDRSDVIIAQAESQIYTAVLAALDVLKAQP